MEPDNLRTVKLNNLRTSRGHWALYAIILVLLFIDSYLNKVWAGTCEDFRVGSILVSNHPGSNENWNENQWPSLYAQCNGWSLGFYENSFSTRHEQLISTMVAYEHYFYEGEYWEWSVMGGAVDGYPSQWKGSEDHRIDISEKKWLPWGSVNAKVGIFKIWIIPTVVTAVGLEYRF